MNLYNDLQRGILVEGEQNARAFVPFPSFTAGLPTALTIYGLQPSGNADTPYTVETVTAATVSLSTITSGVITLVASSSAWSASGQQLTGELAIPGNVTFPTGQQYLQAVLAEDITLSDGTTTHIETPCALRNPSFPVTIPPVNPGLTAVAVDSGDVLQQPTAAALLAANASIGTSAAIMAETTRATAAENLKLAQASNLSDLASASTARTNLGLGTAATQASSAFDASGAATTAQAFAIQRSHHTGTQTLSTISDAGTSASVNTGSASNNVPLNSYLFVSSGVFAAFDASNLTNVSPPAGLYIDPNTPIFTGQDCDSANDGAFAVGPSGRFQTLVLSGFNTLGPLDGSALLNIATSVNGQTGAVTGAQAVAGADVHVLSLMSDENVIAYDFAAVNAVNIGYGATYLDASGISAPSLSAGGALLADGSKIYYPDGATTLADGSYNLYTNALYSGGYQMTDSSGYLYANNMLVSDGTNLYGALSTGRGDAVFTIGGTSYYPHVTGGVLTFTSTP